MSDKVDGKDVKTTTKTSISDAASPPSFLTSGGNKPRSAPRLKRDPHKVRQLIEAQTREFVETRRARVWKDFISKFKPYFVHEVKDKNETTDEAAGSEEGGEADDENNEKNNEKTKGKDEQLRSWLTNVELQAWNRSSNIYAYINLLYTIRTIALHYPGGVFSFIQTFPPDQPVMYTTAFTKTVVANIDSQYQKRVAHMATQQAEWSEERASEEAQRVYDTDGTDNTSSSDLLVERAQCPKCGMRTKKTGRANKIRASDEGLASLNKCSNPECRHEWNAESL